MFDDYMLIVPFLVFNWLWCMWNALELKGTKTYGMQNKYILLSIYFLSIFKYVNFVVTILIVLYTIEMIKRDLNYKRALKAGPIQSVLMKAIKRHSDLLRQKKKDGHTD